MKQSPLAERLGIEVPLIQAPMAAVSTPEMAAAVSNAGGLGMLASAMMTPDQFGAAMARVRQATNKPFGVNFFVHDPPDLDPKREAKLRARLAPYYDELGIEPPGDLPIAPRFDDVMLKAVVETTPAVVTFHFGLPEPADVEAVKEAGGGRVEFGDDGWRGQASSKPAAPMRSSLKATKPAATAAPSPARSKTRRSAPSRWYRKWSMLWRCR